MKLFLLLGFSAFFNNLLNFGILPFFPLISKEKNISISLIGIILTINSIGSAVAILLIKYFKDSNPFKLIIKSNLILQLIICIFGFLNKINNENLFCISNALTLFCIGVIRTFGLSYIYGTVGIIYKNNNELQKKRYALAKLIGNSGQIFGTIIGGLLFKFFGYSGMFNILAIIYFIITLLFLFLLRNEINNFNEDNFNKETNYKISKIYCEKKIYLSFLFLLASAIVGQIIRPGFSIHLKNSFNIENSEVSYYFTFYGIGTTIGNFIVIISMKYFGDITLIYFSFVLGIIGLILVGPTTFIGLPLNIYLVVFALTLLGFSKSFINIPNFNFFFNVLFNEEEFSLNEKNSNIIASFINEFIFSFSGISGPFIGGFLTDYLNFADGMFIYALFCSLIFICFISFINLFKIDKLKEKIKNSLVENLN